MEARSVCRAFPRGVRSAGPALAWEQALECPTEAGSPAEACVRCTSRLVNHSFRPHPPDSVDLGGAQEFCIFIKLQVMLMPLVREIHTSEPDCSLVSEESLTDLNSCITLGNVIFSPPLRVTNFLPEFLCDSIYLPFHTVSFNFPALGEK